MSPTQNTTKDPIGGVLLIASDSVQRSQTGEFLQQLGYAVMDEPPEGSELEIVVIAAGSALDVESPIAASKGEYPPPLVVFGPANSGTWRKEALEVGAFACLSWEAPVEERASVLAAASRFRASQREIQIIRRESEFLTTQLLQTYGEEAQKLQMAVEEREETKEDLERIRKRILRSIL